MNAEAAYTALLAWNIDASESELKDINVTREDVVRLARTFEFQISPTRRDELTAIGRSLLIAYRDGQMTGPNK